MTDNEQKQQLSMAYIHAVAARAGFACEYPRIDNDSVDLGICAQGRVHDRAVVRSPRIEVQVKATADDKLANGHLAFPLPIKNYNDLRKKTMVPRLLVVLQLPDNPDEWLNVTEEQMISRRCAYYRSLLDEPSTENRETITVHLPRENVLTVSAITGLMERISRGEPL